MWRRGEEAGPSRLEWVQKCVRHKRSARMKGQVYRTEVKQALLNGLETVSVMKRKEAEPKVKELQC